MNRLILDLNINLCWSFGELREKETFTIPFADKAKELLDGTNNQVLIEKLLTSYPQIIYPTISNYGQVLFLAAQKSFTKQEENSQTRYQPCMKTHLTDHINCLKNYW